MDAIVIPLVTWSEANRTCQTRGAAIAHTRRVKRQRTTTRDYCRALVGCTPALPCTITLTRVAPRALDDDNLRGALKHIRDGVADWLGVADNDARVQWVYAQRRGRVGEHGVEVGVQ